MRRPHLDAVEDDSVSGSRDDGREHERAAGDLEPPAGTALARRVELREQRDAVAARHDLERHDQRLPRRIPFEIEFGAVDVDPAQRLVGVDDDSPCRAGCGPRSSAGCRRRRSAARMRADTGMFGSYWPSPMRSASSRSLAGKPFGLDLDDADAAARRASRVARSSQGRSPASEPIVSAMPPPFGRVRLRLMSWNVHCLPLR